MQNCNAEGKCVWVPQRKKEESVMRNKNSSFHIVVNNICRVHGAYVEWWHKLKSFKKYPSLNPTATFQIWVISNIFTFFLCCFFFSDLFTECSGPLGIEGGIISNQQITASSTHRALFGLQKWYPYYARLNKKGLINAWTAAENDRWPWIQVTDGMGQGYCQRMTGVLLERRQWEPKYDFSSWSTRKG